MKSKFRMAALALLAIISLTACGPIGGSGGIPLPGAPGVATSYAVAVVTVLDANGKPAPIASMPDVMISLEAKDREGEFALGTPIDHIPMLSNPWVQTFSWVTGELDYIDLYAQINGRALPGWALVAEWRYTDNRATGNLNGHHMDVNTRVDPIPLDANAIYDADQDGV